MGAPENTPVPQPQPQAQPYPPQQYAQPQPQQHQPQQHQPQQHQQPAGYPQPQPQYMPGAAVIYPQTSAPQNEFAPSNVGAVHVPQHDPQQHVQQGQPAPGFPQPHYAPQQEQHEGHPPQQLQYPAHGGTAYAELEAPHMLVNISGLSGEDLACELKRPDRVIVWRMGDWFREGWEAYKQHWWAWSLLTLVVVLLTVISSTFVPGVSLFLGPISWGIFVAAANVMRPGSDGRLQAKQLFVGGIFLYGPLLLLLFLQALVVSIGFAFFIVPGVYLSVILCAWAPVYIEFHTRQIGIFKAASISATVLRRHWCATFGFVLLSQLLVLAGILALGVGCLVSIPVAGLAMVAFFRDVFTLTPADEHEIDEGCVCC